MFTASGKKIVIVDEKDSTVDEKKKKNFQLRTDLHIDIQYYDNEWSDWINVDCTADLPDRAKLQVTTIEKVLNVADNAEVEACSPEHSAELTR